MNHRTRFIQIALLSLTWDAQVLVQSELDPTLLILRTDLCSRDKAGSPNRRKRIPGTIRLQEVLLKSMLQMAAPCCSSSSLSVLGIGHRPAGTQQISVNNTLKHISAPKICVARADRDAHLGLTSAGAHPASAQDWGHTPTCPGASDADKVDADAGSPVPLGTPGRSETHIEPEFTKPGL